MVHHIKPIWLNIKTSKYIPTKQMTGNKHLMSPDASVPTELRHLHYWRQITFISHTYEPAANWFLGHFYLSGLGLTLLTLYVIQSSNRVATVMTIMIAGGGSRFCEVTLCHCSSCSVHRKLFHHPMTVPLSGSCGAYGYRNRKVCPRSWPLESLFSSESSLHDLWWRLRLLEWWSFLLDICSSSLPL